MAPPPIEKPALTTWSIDHQKGMAADGTPTSARRSSRNASAELPSVNSSTTARKRTSDAGSSPTAGPHADAASGVRFGASTLRSSSRSRVSSNTATAPGTIVRPNSRRNWPG
jgi:hypothetical protein